MKAIIENGGVDVSGLSYTLKYECFAEFNLILEYICMSVDAEDLIANLQKLFEVKKESKFRYSTGMFPGNDDLDNPDYLEIHQEGIPVRLIYVELKN